MRFNSPHTRTGFTLVEVLMAVAVLAMLALLVVPMSSDDHRARLNAAVSVLVSDIELAQVMNVAAPNDPVVIRFDPENQSYWLARLSSPNDPISRAGTTDPYVVIMGHGRGASATGVTMSVSDMPANTLRFNPHGGLADIQSSPTVVLQAQNNSARRQATIGIASTTGRIVIDTQDG